MQRRYNAHSHWWRRHGTSSHCSGEGTSIFLYLLVVNVIFFSCMVCSPIFILHVSERICSFGPVWKGDGRVHCQLHVSWGFGECESSLALIRQLQRGRGRQHSCQRGVPSQSIIFWSFICYILISHLNRFFFFFPSPTQCENEPPLAPTVMTFLENHGKNIQLSNQNLTAARVSSYNQGLLVTAQALPRQQLFQVCVSVFGSDRQCQ